MKPRFVVSATAALFLGAAAALGAQPAPSPSPSPSGAPAPTIPGGARVDPYVRQAIDIIAGAVRRKIDTFGNSNVGQVTYFKRFEMQIATGTNAYRSIHLHQGTVIDPRGATIAVGQRVDVSGRQESDGSLDADTITIVR